MVTSEYCASPTRRRGGGASASSSSVMYGWARHRDGRVRDDYARPIAPGCGALRHRFGSGVVIVTGVARRAWDRGDNDSVSGVAVFSIGMVSARVRVLPFGIEHGSPAQTRYSCRGRSSRGRLGATSVLLSLSSSPLALRDDLRQLARRVLLFWMWLLCCRSWSRRGPRSWKEAMRRRGRTPRRADRARVASGHGARRARVRRSGGWTPRLSGARGEVPSVLLPIAPARPSRVAAHALTAAHG